MTSRKPNLKPVEAPVVPPHEAWGNVVTSTRDSAVVKEQALQNDKLTREEYYDRELARLNAARASELQSLDVQISQQKSIQASCDAALNSLKGGNVVPFTGGLTQDALAGGAA